MKRAPKTENKHFKVSFEITGSMIDDDTPLTRQSLTDFVELHFAHRQDCRVVRVEAEEVKE